MRIFLISFGAGLVVGVVYSLLHVRSPAPPVVALVGLLGILIGEQVIPIGRQIIAGNVLRPTYARALSVTHIFGELPGRHTRIERETRS